MKLVAEPARTSSQVTTSRRAKALRRTASRPAIELLECRLVLSTFTWTGLDDGSTWSDAANWSGGQVPTAGSTVVFPPIASEQAPSTGVMYPPVGTIDIATADVASVIVDDNYTFEGLPKGAENQLTIDSGGAITTGVGDVLTFAPNLVVNNLGPASEAGAGSIQLHVSGEPSPGLVPASITSGVQTFVSSATTAKTLYTVNQGGTLEISSGTSGMAGSLDGNGVVQMDGTGASLSFVTPENESDIFAGSFTGNGQGSSGGSIAMNGAGTLSIGVINQGTSPNNAGPASFQIAANSGTLLIGTAAYLEDGTGVPALNVKPGAEFGGAGLINDAGQALFNNGSIFAVVLNGAAAGKATQLVDTGPDSNTNGTAVQIAGSNLSVLGFGDGYEPAMGDTFTIMSATNGTISGQFANAQNGATVVVDNVPFQINYVADAAKDGNFSAITLTAMGTMTTTQLVSSANPTFGGEPITFTATVSSRSGPVTVGTVTFEQGSTILAQNVALSGSGVATSPVITSLAPGSLPITAVYSGNTGSSTDVLGSSMSINQVVNVNPTSTVVSSSANPSYFGQLITFTATVQNTAPGAAGSPTGTVQFYINGVAYQNPITLIGTSATTSKASVSDAAIVAGANPSITATYTNADGFYAGGSSNKLVQTVNPASYPTTTKLTTSASPAQFGQPVSFVATIRNTASNNTSSPTGTVQFYIDGRKYLSPIKLIAAGASLSTAGVTISSLTAAGTHTISVVYTNTDGNFLANAGNQVQETVSPDATTTSLSGSTTASYAGQPVSFTATVRNNSPMGAGAPTGSVQFYVDGAPYLGPIALSAISSVSSTATINDSALAVGGPHNVYAVYANSDGNFSTTKPTSNVVSDSVSILTTKMVSLTAVRVPKANRRARQTYELVAVVQTTTPGFTSIYPTGLVALGLKNKAIGSMQPLTNGVAYFPLGTTNPRGKKYSAIFEGSVSFAKAPTPIALS
jgi:hypothetical protein